MTKNLSVGVCNLTLIMIPTFDDRVHHFAPSVLRVASQLVRSGVPRSLGVVGLQSLPRKCLS